MPNRVTVLISLDTEAEVSDTALSHLARESAASIKVDGYRVVEATAVRYSDGAVAIHPATQEV